MKIEEVQSTTKKQRIATHTHIKGLGLEAVITGKGGHAAIPQYTIDPILAASNVIISLQHLVSREADPLDSQHCKVVDLGIAHDDEEQLERVLNHVRSLA